MAPGQTKRDSPCRPGERTTQAAARKGLQLRLCGQAEIGTCFNRPNARESTGCQNRCGLTASLGLPTEPAWGRSQYGMQTGVPWIRDEKAGWFFYGSFSRLAHASSHSSTSNSLNGFLITETPISWRAVLCSSVLDVVILAIFGVGILQKLWLLLVSH